MSPRLDAVEEVTRDDGRAGRRRERLRARVQIRFTTRSGSNLFTGSALLLLPERLAQHEHLLQQGARPAEGSDHARPAGHSGGRSGRDPGAVRRPRQGVLLRQLRGVRSPGTITTNSNSCCPTRRTACSATPGGPADGVNLYALAARQRPDRDAGSDGRQAAAGHPQLAASSGGVLSGAHRQLNTERYYVPAADRRGRSTTRRSASTTTSVGAPRCRALYHDSVSPTPRHDQHAAADLAGLPALRRAGLVARGATPASLRSTLSRTRQRGARRRTRRAGRVLGRPRPRHVHRTLANQRGYAPRHQRRAASPTPGRTHAQRPRRRRRHVHRTR